jgi:hypothetical protein
MHGVKIKTILITYEDKLIFCGTSKQTACVELQIFKTEVNLDYI